MFAHGPWWTEWHHVLPMVPLGVVAVSAWLSRRSKRRDE